MERKIGEKFTCKERSCIVREITGDCQSVWREGKRNVFLGDAALARSPLGAAAANSAKIPIDASKILHLHLKKEWFNMIECGEKREEYRNVTEYWRKRFANKNYTHILFYYGYTKTRMLVPIRYIKEGIGRTDWGAPSNKIVYIFGLGEIIDENRWKILRDV